MYVFRIAEGFALFLSEIVLKIVAIALALSIWSLFPVLISITSVFFRWQRKSKKVHMIVTSSLGFLSVTGIDDEHLSLEDIPDLFFPVAQADINECSTYAVVCRLKSSPTYTITSAGGLFSHPDYPGVTVTIPENAVAPDAPFTLELKVGVIKKA